MADGNGFAQVRDFALQKGFDRVIALPPQAFTKWQKAMESVDADHRASRLLADPFAILPSATAIIVLIKGYAPFSGFPAGFGHIPSYYLLTQHTRLWVQETAAYIKNAFGANAVASPKLPHRAAAILGGAGRQGYNQLLLTPDFGSYTNISLILTDALAPPKPPAHAPALCTGCGACASACPTRAIKGDGTWDYRRCLRHHIAVNVFPVDTRDKLSSLLGCDICQNACAVNQSICQPTPAPAEIISAFHLGALLGLKYNLLLKKHIGDLIGNNLLRSNRLLNQALILCANQGLTEHKNAVEALKKDENPFTAELAAWALQHLA